ncbi:MAG: transcriptional regulator [Propionibacteriaceae bacterium]|nr:transcriptional regulator [Propionibacteriaceae bacterium]
MTDMPMSVEAQDATTRLRVMKHIVEHGWTTSVALADEFELTAAAIRRHLAYLLTAGMLTTRSQPVSLRKGAGRPAKEFAATAQGRQTFSHAYDTFAISAVETLHRLGGDEAVTQFFEARFAAIEARFAELRALDADLPQAEALSIALTEDGFMAGVQPVGGGEQLCQHNCPYPSIATRFPQLCTVETSVFSRLLSSHVQRLATIAHGDGVCTTNIPPSTRKEDR